MHCTVTVWHPSCCHTYCMHLYLRKPKLRLSLQTSKMTHILRVWPASERLNALTHPPFWKTCISNPGSVTKIKPCCRILTARTITPNKQIHQIINDNLTVHRYSCMHCNTCSSTSKISAAGIEYVPFSGLSRATQLTKLKTNARIRRSICQSFQPVVNTSWQIVLTWLCVCGLV